MASRDRAVEILLVALVAGVLLVAWVPYHIQVTPSPVPTSDSTDRVARASSPSLFVGAAASPGGGWEYVGRNLSLGLPGAMPAGTVVVASAHEVFTAALPDYVVVTSTVSDSIVATITVGQTQAEDPYLYSGWVSVTTPIVYDPFTGDVIVADQDSNALTAINVSSQKVVGEVSLEAPPDAMALDSENGELFVGTDFPNGTIAAFEIAGNSTSYPVLHTRWTWFGPGWSPPLSMAVDPIDHDVYFTSVPPDCEFGCAGSSLDWFSYATNATGNANVCAEGTSMAFDPLTDEVYVTTDNTLCCFVSAGCLPIAVVAAASHNETATVAGPGEATLGFDPTTDQILAASTDRIYVIEPTNHSLVSSYREDAECPSAIGAGQGLGNVYVPDECGNELVDLSTASGVSRDIVIAGSGPASVAFDSAADDLIVANQNAGNVSILSTNGDVFTSIGGIPGADSVTSVPSAGQDYVTGWNGAVGVLDDRDWNLTAKISLGTSLIPAPVSVYDPASNEVLIAGFNDTGVVLFAISGSLHSVKSRLTLELNYGYIPDGLAYDAANGTVLVGAEELDEIPELAATNLSIVGQCDLPSEDLGVDALAIDPATNQVYVSTVVNNQSLGFPAAIAVFNATSGARITQFDTSEAFESLAFDPNGNVMVGAAPFSDLIAIFNATTYRVSQNITVGQAPDALTYDNLNGALYVANYFSDSLTEITRNLTYPVSVTETGLPPGANWTFDFDGSVKRSNGSGVEFAALNGTYAFWVGGAVGFVPYPPSGVMMVRGRPVMENVAFSPFAFSLSFLESGLPAGTQWSVALNGLERQSDTNSLVFAVPNGSYNFSVSPVSGFAVNPQSGQTSIQNGSQTVPLTFVPTPPIDEIPIWAEAAIVVGIAVCVAALVLLPPKPPQIR